MTLAAESTKNSDTAALEQKRNVLREQNATLLKKQIAQEEQRNAELTGKAKDTPVTEASASQPISGQTAQAEGGPTRTKIGRETDRIVDQTKDKINKLGKLF